MRLNKEMYCQTPITCHKNSWWPLGEMYDKEQRYIFPFDQYKCIKTHYIILTKMCISSRGKGKGQTAVLLIKIFHRVW